MKKTLVMLALATVGFAPVFAAAPAAATQKQPQQQPESQQPASKPVEVKKISGQADEKKTPSTPAQTPASTSKPKLVLIADEKPACCPSCPAEKKDGQKTPAQTPAKSAAPKVALA